ncbi:MAG: electron transfer flavoprotein subunit alpha/FixB family protein [Chloroflexi bacterium]|nr:electron transfer flavoprotein subunit alpha/FixB family protein [Chloroflexota bacterium]
MSADIFVVVEHLRGQVADISYMMLAAARALAQGSGARVVAVLLGNDVDELTRDLAADQVLYVEHPALADFTSDAYQQVLVSVIGEYSPRAVLFGDTSIGGDVAPWLSSHLALPLVSSCRSVRVEQGKAKFLCNTCGGKILAEGDIPEPTALLMMVPGGHKAEGGKSTKTPEVKRVPAPALDNLRVQVKEFIEPATGDVDISKEPILVSIGRGIQNKDNVELAEDLAKALGGVVCGSRPVIDQGWLPMQRLVGKSGKSVKPKLYLALGISGAPEHVEALGGAEMIVAVNTDPAAPIFGLARYGATVDLLDLAPILTDKIREIRGALVEG